MQRFPLFWDCKRCESELAAIDLKAEALPLGLLLETIVHCPLSQFRVSQHTSLIGHVQFVCV